MKAALDEFKQIINSIAFINPAEWEYLEQTLSLKKFEKDTMLHNQGEVIKNFFFIISGSVRKYSENPEGQVTHNVYSTRRFVTDLLSVSAQKPSFYSFEALTDTIVVKIELEFINKLFSMSPTYEKIARVLYQQAFIEETARLKEVLTADPQELYSNFAKTHKHLLTELPQTKIAACLNVAPETLSRIKKKALELETSKA